MLDAIAPTVVEVVIPDIVLLPNNVSPVLSRSLARDVKSLGLLVTRDVLRLTGDDDDGDIFVVKVDPDSFEMKNGADASVTAV